MKEFPTEILSQHVAVLGKTGSGKTSTAKLLVEQVVREHARVCVLDPIKSDWWGLTSSADGKRAGLPFHILGGPRGHVPLHADAGKVVGEIVASAALPLSIVDMADFEPGGQVKFFKDFAPALLRKMRGVVYLVLEEAHLFAPKERSGIGEENLAIHWAKTLATAGRSKGIRLVLVTQRTQALHNALLGSCDTMLAHRLTAPADQEPVIKWLKANTSKEVLEQVTGSLASLKTGDAWLCSGEAKRFEIVYFPRITTYDNTATPTGDGDTREIKTAPVDQDKLRAIIGDAAEKAKADDPKELKRQLGHVSAQIAVKDKRISELEARVSSTSGFAPSNEAKKPVLTDADRALLEKVHEKYSAVAASLTELQSFNVDGLLEVIREELRGFLDFHRIEQSKARDAFIAIAEGKALHKVLDKIATVKAPANYSESMTAARGPSAQVPAMTRVERQPSVRPSGDGSLSGPEVKILTALAELEALGLSPADKQQLGLIAGYTNVRSGGFSEPLGRLITGGYALAPRPGVVKLTDAGRAYVGSVDAPSTSGELQDRIIRNLTGPETKLLRVLIAQYPAGMTKDALGTATNYTNIRSGGFSEPLGHLSKLGLVESPVRGEVVASRALFLEAR